MCENSEKYFEGTKDIKMSDIIEDGISAKKLSDSVSAGITDIIVAVLTVSATYFSFFVMDENSADIMLSIVYFLFSAFSIAVTVFREKKFRKAAILPAVLLFTVIISFSLVSTYDTLKMLLCCYLYGCTICALNGIPSFPVSSVEDIFFQLKALFLIPIRNVFLPIVVFIKKIIAYRKNDHKALKKTAGILFGIILAVPVFIAVSSLLEDADFAFHYYYSSLFSGFSRAFKVITAKFPFDTDILVPTLLLSPFVFSFIFCANHGITKNGIDKIKEKENIKKLSFVGAGITGGFYSLISLAYIVFIFSQFTYLFAAFSGELPFGYSVSGYARQGFFEMSTVAAINFGLIILGEIFSRRKSDGSLPKIWKYFSLFFCIFTLLLIIIAAAKMMLYINTYGLTGKRIAVIIADIILFMTFIVTGISLFRKNVPHFRIVISSFTVAAVLLVIIPLGAVSAAFNTGMYLSGHHKTIDTDSIRFSDSLFIAGEELYKITASANRFKAIEAKENLYTLIYYNDDYAKRVNTLDTYLFRSFINEHKDEIEDFSPEDLKGYGNIPTHPVTEQNFVCASIYLTLDMPSSVTRIEIKNSLFTTTVRNNDGSPLSVGEYIPVHDWCVIDGNGEFAVITLYLENGEAHSFELRKDRFFVSDDPERCINVGKTDHFSGTFTVKPDGQIYLSKISVDNRGNFW